MTLSEKAEKIYKKLMENDYKSILISEEELAKAKIQKENSKDDKKDFSSAVSIIQKKDLKIQQNYEINDNINPVKIQKSEIENLFKNKKKVEHERINSELNILDKMVSNTKIFLKNLIYIQNTKELFNYLDINLSSYFYINSFAIFFNKSLVHYFNINKEKIPNIINFTSNFPEDFENNFTLKQIDLNLSDHSEFSNYFLYPIFISNKNVGFIIIEIDKNFYKNEYYLDFLAMLLSMIPSLVPAIIPILNYKNNFFDNLFEKISSKTQIFLYSYLNPPFPTLNLSILNSYLSDFESILQSQDLININFKKFISLKINENIEKTFKFLNQKYNIDNNPIIKYRTIQGSKESIKQQLISYL